LVNDLPSIIVMVIIIAAYFTIRYLVRLWSDKRLTARQAQALQVSDDLMRDYRAPHTTARVTPSDRLGATWRRTYKDEEHWKETAPESPPKHR
jgi:hypothetical protein